MSQRDAGPIFVTGGTGFVGHAIVTRLLTGGHRLRLLVRPDSTYDPPNGVETVVGDVTDPASLSGKLDGCVAVIHLVGIIEERGEATFDRVIRWGTENIVAAAATAGVERFILMSALGARYDLEYPYHLAKYGAEQAVIRSGLDYTIFRPAVIFGPGDGFMTILANLVRRAPLTPVIGSGKTPFQPIQVGDVADCFARAIDDPVATRGHTFELGGGASYSYQQMLELIGARIGRSRPKVHVPIAFMRAIVGLTSRLPRALRPPVTTEQLKMLALDNSVPDSATESLIRRPPVSLENGIDYLATA